MKPSTNDQGHESTASVSSIRLLGTPLMITDYAGLSAACLAWARTQTPVAVEFANTQVVIMRRAEADFRRFTTACDYFSPDGMPLIWCLNRAGAKLRDRVYGPTFMRKFLETVPAGYTHYLMGGSDECGRRLQETFEKVNPTVRFVGGYHGRCSPAGELDPTDEAHVLEDIERISPDFIWVGFGTPKQQAWLERYKPRIKRGVILTVGFAFDVNAGMKPDAPAWMQRFGLTWVYRLASEPRRLLGRYIKYNSLFLWFLLWDGLRGKAIQRNLPS